VLTDAHHLDLTQHGHAELGHPGRQDRFESALQQCQPVRVAAREVADVERDAGERGDLHRLSRLEEPVGDAPLVEHLDRPCVDPAGPCAVDVLIRSALEHHHVDIAERQLSREHQSGRPTPHDHHVVFRRRVSHRSLLPIGPTPDRPRATM
jgi:hypothetical protein